MASVESSTSSYITHVIKGLPSAYNLMKRLSVVLGTRESLNEDSLTSFILRDKAMQEAEKSTELLQQVNYVVPINQGGQPGQRGKPGGQCIVEQTVSLAPEAGEDFQAVAATVQANPALVLLDSGCSHHLMWTKTAFVDLGPSSNVKHMRGFSGALQDIQGRGSVALQGKAGKQVLIPDVLYVSGVQANLLSPGQLKESGVKPSG
ncbi:unnamed protein product [Closterium sp. Naga37s-1]|nr:unnamed protein product [Closterium sp. Naga37s-1]